jgi:predicted dehydrogenase
MDSYKMLICGCGGAGLAVAQVIATDGRANIVGLVDPEGAQLQRAQERHPGARAGSDYERVLDQTRPDVVVVAGPDHLHADQTLTALAHGCHVLVEKPLATTVTDAQRIVDAVAATGLHVMADHTMRYVYPCGEMARAAKRGDVGQIFFLQGDYIHDMWSYYAPTGSNYTPWRDDEEHPQNILLGGGCHPIDLMLWTVESPVAEVYAYSNKMSVPEFPSDDCYIAMMQFENGVLGKVYVTSGCSGHGMGGGFLAVYGTEGTLWKGTLIRRGQESVALEETSLGSVVAGHGWGQSVVQFLDVLGNKIANPIPARVGARTVAVCEAALQSIQSGHPQRPVRF